MVILFFCHIPDLSVVLYNIIVLCTDISVKINVLDKNNKVLQPADVELSFLSQADSD